MPFRVFAALALLNCVHLLRADEPPKIAPKGKSVSVKVVDEQGNAVGGADVGTMAALGKLYVDRATKEGTEWLYVNHKRSDASGVAVIDDAEEWLGHLCVVVRHEGRKIAAAVNIDPTTAKDSPVVVTLRPTQDHRESKLPGIAGAAQQFTVAGRLCPPRRKESSRNAVE